MGGATETGKIQTLLPFTFFQIFHCLFHEVAAEILKRSNSRLLFIYA